MIGLDQATRERQAVNATSLGFAARLNVTQEDGASVGLTLPGEIDLLAAEPRRGRIWVAEIKDQTAAASPRMMRQRADRFFGPRGHIENLVAKAAVFGENPDAAATLVSSDTPACPWRVVPLMITRVVELAAFADGVSVPFVLLADLEGLLKHIGDPVPGPFPIVLD